MGGGDGGGVAESEWREIVGGVDRQAGTRHSWALRAGCLALGTRGAALLKQLGCAGGSSGGGALSA